LRDAGILSERTGRGRSGVFTADEALAIVDRPFGKEPEPPIRAAMGQEHYFWFASECLP